MISTRRLYENGRDIQFGLSKDLPAEGRPGDVFYAMDTGAWSMWGENDWEDFTMPIGGGGGSSVTVEALAVTANGDYTAPQGKAYSPVSVDVANTYTAGDEGKVVRSGALAAQTSRSVSANGTYDTTENNEVVVDVAQTTVTALTATENGTYSAPAGTAYSPVTVSVSSGGGGDEADEIIMRTISGAYENSRVTEIGKCAFYTCSALTAVSFPAATSIGASAFYTCRALTAVSFPAATSIGASAFESCRALTAASFPEATSIGGSAFYNCRALTAASFPAAQTVSSLTFANCNNLVSLYLASTSVATLGNSNAFNSTPIGGYSASAGRYGSIYVPASLLSSYQTATNWAYFSSRFASI